MCRIGIQASMGGNRYLGRTIPRLLSATGFIDIDMDATLQHSDLLGVEGFRQQFNVERFRGLYEKGILELDEFEQIRAASERLTMSKDAYAMMTFFMGCGTKPEG